MNELVERLPSGTDLHALSNLLRGYVDKGVPDDVSAFLMDSAKIADEMSDEIERLTALTASPPVEARAWLWTNELGERMLTGYCPQSEGGKGIRGLVPLYTHPPVTPDAAGEVARLREEQSQRLQAHMEQHHGVCLTASEWDAAVAALKGTTDAAGAAK